MPECFHPWNVTPRQALALQKELAARVTRKNSFGTIKTVAGIDAGFQGSSITGAVVVLGFPNLEPVDSATAIQPVTFPYVPGLLTFREGPVILEAISRLTRRPDLLIFDGQGIAHPRRLGIASHIGVLLDLPSIGCAKSKLCGHHNTPGEQKGSYEPLIHGEDIIGAAVRTRTRVKPVYVSIGHRIDLPTSISFIMACCGRYRLPEPTRLAHRAAAAQILF